MRHDIDNRLSVLEIARYLGVTKHRVYGWAAAGKIKLLRSTNGPLYATRDEVDRFASGFVRTRPMEVET